MQLLTVGYLISEALWLNAGSGYDESFRAAATGSNRARLDGLQV